MNDKSQLSRFLVIKILLTKFHKNESHCSK